MRKSLALLALVATFWSQLSALGCEMRSFDVRTGAGDGHAGVVLPAGAGRHAGGAHAMREPDGAHAPGAVRGSVGSSESHESHPAHESRPADRDGSGASHGSHAADHDGSDHDHGPNGAACTLLMACGVSAVAHRIADLSVVPAALADVGVHRPSVGPEGTDLTADPPPPRARS